MGNHSMNLNSLRGQVNDELLLFYTYITYGSLPTVYLDDPKYNHDYSYDFPFNLY